MTTKQNNFSIFRVQWLLFSTGFDVIVYHRFSPPTISCKILKNVERNKKSSLKLTTVFQTQSSISCLFIISVPNFLVLSQLEIICF